MRWQRRPRRNTIVNGNTLQWLCVCACLRLCPCWVNCSLLTYKRQACVQTQCTIFFFFVIIACSHSAQLLMWSIQYKQVGTSNCTHTDRFGSTWGFISSVVRKVTAGEDRSGQRERFIESAVLHSPLTLTFITFLTRLWHAMLLLCHILSLM